MNNRDRCRHKPARHRPASGGGFERGCLLTFTGFLTVVLVLASPTRLGAAELPKLIPFQARLADAAGQPLPEGTRVVQFKIYDQPLGGTNVWPGEVQLLSVNGGQVNTTLGTKASLEGVDFRQALYLELTLDVNDDGEITAADPPLVPRELIPAAVFAKETANARMLAGRDWSSLFGEIDPSSNPIPEAKLPPGVPLPVGGVIAWWGGAGDLPPGFEVCDGGEPTTPGALLKGNKPDLRDRFVQGAGPGATDVAGNPAVGGANTIGEGISGDTAITLEQMPPHPHTVGLGTSAAGGHAHALPIAQNGNQGVYGIYAATTTFFGIQLPVGGGFSGPHARSTDVSGEHTHNFSGDTGVTGAGQAHNHTLPAHDNRPAFLELFYIIRVK